MTSPNLVHLPDFCLDHQFQPRQGKHDQLVLDVGGWGFDQVASEHRQEILADVATAGHFEHSDGQTYRLFRSSSSGLGNAAKVEIRTRGRPEPILKGQSKWLRGSRSHEMPARDTLGFSLRFNPTIALQSQPLRRDRNGPRVETAVDVRSEGRNLPRGVNGEVVLTPTANLIIGGPRRYDVLLPDRWNVAVMDAFQLCIHSLDEAVSQSVAAHMGCLRETEYVSFQKAEVYWEFWCDDAIQKMAELLPAVRAIGRSASTREHATFPRFQHALNSASAKFDWERGVEIAIYPKTNRRLRLEVRLSDPAICISRSAPNMPRRVIRQFSEFPFALEALQNEAAVHANEFWRILAGQLNQTEPQNSVFDLFEAVRARVPDRAHARLILSLLARRGSVVRRRGDDPLRQAILNLDGAVIEQTRPRSGIFVVVPQYRRAVRLLLAEMNLEAEFDRQGSALTQRQPFEAS